MARGVGYVRPWVRVRAERAAFSFLATDYQGLLVYCGSRYVFSSSLFLSLSPPLSFRLSIVCSLQFFPPLARGVGKEEAAGGVRAGSWRLSQN
jgi:hypothetical protein